MTVSDAVTVSIDVPKELHSKSNSSILFVHFDSAVS